MTTQNQETQPLQQENNYSKLAAINVSGHIEKKNGLSFLSWSWAVDQLMRLDPQANWSFREPVVYADGSMMVHCDVIVYGKSMYMFLPVMNYSNKAITNPNAFDINKAMMRCLVKGIAVHGLGLYIYAGEDLPEDEKQAQQQNNQQAQTAQANNRQQQGQMQQQKPIEQRYRDALKSIENAKNPATLDRAINTFGPTKYAEAIQRACDARADQMGWSAPPNQNSNPNQNQLRN